MGSTRIEWTDRTWNPVTGCTKVSAGCKHCYAEVMAKRTFGRLYPTVAIGPTLPDGGPTAWRDRRFTDVQCHPDRLDAPLRWRKPSMVFVNSMSDLFHEAVPDEFIDQVFAVMHTGKYLGHVFQVLTKRPERMRAYMSDQTRPIAIDAALLRLSHDTGRGVMCLTQPGVPGGFEGWPPPNVWLGVSVEDQATADERIPLLLQTPAAIRFVSYEPALADVDFTNLKYDRVYGTGLLNALTGERRGHVPHSPLGTWPRLDWLIVGGESGPKARPCDVAWIRSVVQQCQAAEVQAFVKQLGARPVLVDAAGNIGFRGMLKIWPSLPDGFYSFLNDRKGADPSEWPPDLWVREMPEVARG